MRQLFNMNEETLRAVARNVKAPIAKKRDHVLESHGHQRNDPFFWMRERDNPEVVEYLNAENTYTESVLAPIKELRESLFNEMVDRIQKTDMSVPFWLDNYLYYTRFEEGKQYAIHCRKHESDENPENAFLDINEMAEGKEYCSITGLSVSKSHRYLAFGEDFIGRRKYTLRVKDLQTGEIFPLSISETSGNYCWAADDEFLFYLLKDEQTLRPRKVMRHQMGTSSDLDVCVFDEPDESFYVAVSKTKSREYLFIQVSSTDVSEVLILNASRPTESFSIFLPRQESHEYSVDHAEGQFYILSNSDAKNFRLLTCAEQNYARENWAELIPHRNDVLLEGFTLLKDHLILSERVRGLTMLRVLNQKKKADFYLHFEDQAYSVWTDNNPNYASSLLRYGYNSLTTPPSIYDYDLTNGQIHLLKQEEVIGGHNPKDYVSERFFVPAEDGKEIPVSVVFKNTFLKTGKGKVYLTGYGSYGHSFDPYFSSARLSLLDRGFAYVIAHVRGGEDLGREWYESGRLLQKTNSFTDFISVAKKIIALKYCSAESLVINGGSAGGLLMGAVMNMAPELFKVVVADVPFVDVVSTMLDETIPLTVGEYTEWGNPNEKEYYDYMLAYSPYDNVKPGAYPHLLVNSGFHDSQVQYWEPTKWVAKLRDLKTDQNLILLHTEMGAGHSGKSGRFERYKQVALEYAFILSVLNN